MSRFECKDRIIGMAAVIESDHEVTLGYLSVRSVRGALRFCTRGLEDAANGRDQLLLVETVWGSNVYQDVLLCTPSILCRI